MTSKQRVIEKFAAFMDELEAFVSQNSSPQVAEPKESELDTLLKLLESDQWVEAVPPELICDPNSEDDQLERAEAILDDVPEDLTGKKFLDFGCGRGFVVKKSRSLGAESIGYDIKNDGWDSEFLTTDFEVVKSKSPFDVILLYDVLDHCKDPVAALKQVAEVCDDNTKVYVVCHPWSSRHGSHLYNTKNKAFIHLVFSDQELKDMGLETDVNRVYSPILTYQGYFRDAGFRASKPDISQDQPEPFFRNNMLIRKRIMKNMGKNEYPEFQMSQNFLKFVLRK